jgi:pSer/pThr/pTyr-binding forkhead associated (FHA) protein
VAWLVEEQGPNTGRRWPLQLGETTLGRHSTANDIVVRSRQASRRHSAIRTDADGCFYYDIEPTNPTLINEEPLVGAHQLAEGDRLLIGDVILRFTKEG